MDTWNIWDNSTRYVVDGVEIPIYHALILLLVIPNRLDKSLGDNCLFSLNILMRSAIILTTSFHFYCMITRMKLYYPVDYTIAIMIIANLHVKNMRVK